MKNFPVVVKILIFTIFLASCGTVTKSTTLSPAASSEESNLPTPASTLPELVINLSSDNIGVRLVSIYALEEYGDTAESFIPLLINNLYDDDFDIRRAAAYVLGKLGDRAKSAVPALIIVLQNDDSFQTRTTAAYALGQIGEQSSIPFLATVLFEENQINYGYGLVISCAKAIAQITGENFTDINSLAYTLNKDGIPLIVIDAQIWWREKGQFQDWGKK